MRHDDDTSLDRRQALKCAEGHPVAWWADIERDYVERDYLAVSDLSPTDLDAFVAAFRRAAAKDQGGGGGGKRGVSSYGPESMGALCQRVHVSRGTQVFALQLQTAHNHRLANLRLKADYVLLFRSMFLPVNCDSLIT